MSVVRKVLIINGAERSFICDTEKDSLADVIRNLGLTGTKVGCDAGQCGACNVILNGKLIRTCTRKIAKVEDYSTVETIEGVGTADNLHPLQKAWIKYGGVQCGFCTPGFIVSATALLAENPAPTREEVRKWFLKNRNACRCTGYKPIVDAVMAAAKVMRGEASDSDLEFVMPEDGKIFNTAYPRPSALGRVLGTVDYGADIAAKFPGMLHLALVLPEYGHANIKHIDISEAERAPGVVKVVTAKDVKGTNRLVMPLGTPWALGDGADKPVICDEKVFRRGDPLAVICAETRRQAREAAKLVKVEYEVLPEYINIIDAAQEDAVEIHPGLPNLYLKQPLYKGEDTRAIFENAPNVVEFNFHTQRQSHLPIEPDCGNAFIDEDGVVTVLYKTHGVYMTKNSMLAAIGMPADKVRVILNPSGGAFGYSVGVNTPAILAVCTMATGRPCSIVLSYEEHQHNSGKRGPQYSNSRMACDENGKILAVESHILGDKGCYSDKTNGTINSLMKFFGYLYNIPNARLLGTLTFSNTPFVTAYRCPGSMEINASFEQMCDMMCEKLGMDPLAFREINCWREEACDPLWVTQPPAYVIPGILAAAKPKWEELKAHAAANNNVPGKKLGVGLAMGGFRISFYGDHAEVAIELNPDNTITVFSTWEDLGQGGDVSTLAMMHQALLPMNVSPDRIKMVMCDTATCPNTGLSGSSRQNIVNQGSIQNGCEQLMDAMRKADGTYRTYDEMVAENIPTKYIGVFDAPKEIQEDLLTGLGAEAYDGTQSIYLAEVEVDEATGNVKILEYHCITDAGITTNILALEGQGYSGMMHCAGFALSEDYSDMKKHTNLIGCGFPFIDLLPDDDKFTVKNMETPRKYSAMGGTGCSEGFQAGGQSAILNAVYNAVGIRVPGTPAKPDKIKAALDAKANGSYAPQEPFFLGCDFEETFAYLKANPPKGLKHDEDIDADLKAI